jgi:hypothetical protein
VEWGNGYLGVQIRGWLYGDERGVLEVPESDLSLTTCEPLKSWVRDLEKTMSTIKSLLKRTAEDLGANEAEKESGNEV